MKARFIGCLVDGVRERRVGFTLGAMYYITDVELVGGVPRFVLNDDDGDLRHRPQSDFEVVR